MKLRQRLVEGNVILLDVRPVEEYEAAHLPDAISIPVTDLEARLPELPQDKEIVAYCRGPYCVFADEAAFPSKRKVSNTPSPSTRGSYGRALWAVRRNGSGAPTIR